MLMHSAVEVVVRLPTWVEDYVGQASACSDDESRMRFTIGLARQNVEHETGGPFGAAVFEVETGQCVGIGVNRVVPLHNAVLHAEVMAIMQAQARVRHYSLCGHEGAHYVLYSSCDPCAMCLGAIFWSGLQRVVCAASKADAACLGFDEGPVFPASYQYLAERGFQFEHGLLADEAQRVFQQYGEQQGKLYNGHCHVNHA